MKLLHNPKDLLVCCRVEEVNKTLQLQNNELEKDFFPGKHTSLSTINFMVLTYGIVHHLIIVLQTKQWINQL